MVIPKELYKKIEQKVETLSILFSGHVEMVKMLIDHGAHLNYTDNQKYTPLHEAAFQGNSDKIAF